MIRVFLGYDSRESVAFHVACHSLHQRSSRPVAVAPVMLSQLERVFARPRDPKQSTEFSFSRFLVPYLCGFEGWAIFADCDILFVDDVARLWDLRDERYAVQVVQHDHRPTASHKFLGHLQTSYPRKNWSSVMLFNNARCRALSPEYVSTASGLALHRFHWLAHDEEIGALPARWNHLVDYDPVRPLAELSALHYTEGGPWFAGTAECGYAAAWREEFRHAFHPLEESPVLHRAA